MLLDESPALLISSTTSNFNTHPDLLSLSRITSSISTLRDSHSLRLSTASTSLKRTHRTLSTLQQQHDYALTTHDPSGHASKILEMDRQKFRLAKECSDLEVEGERLDAEVKSAEGQNKVLEREGVSGYEVRRAKDDVAREEMEVLKLKVYRSLGIEVVGDLSKGAKGWRRAVVKDRSGMARVIDFENEEHKSSIWKS